MGDKTIEWRHLYQAYKWDQSNNSLKIHERLTEEHFNLGYASKMRNHLAEEVLSKKMIYLLQVLFKNVNLSSIIIITGTSLLTQELKLQCISTNIKYVYQFIKGKTVKNYKNTIPVMGHISPSFSFGQLGLTSLGNYNNYQDSCYFGINM